MCVYKLISHFFENQHLLMNNINIPSDLLFYYFFIFLFSFYSTSMLYMTENTCSKDSYRWLFKCMDECRTYWNYHSDGILLTDFSILLFLFVDIRKFIRDQLKSCCCRLFFVLVSCVPCLCSNTRSAICSMSLTFMFELSLALLWREMETPTI